MCVSHNAQFILLCIILLHVFNFASFVCLSSCNYNNQQDKLLKYWLAMK